jgi:hypothetical protein
LLRKHEKKHVKGAIIQHYMCQCGLEFKSLIEHKTHVSESEGKRGHVSIAIKCTNIFFQSLDSNKLLKAQCAYCNTFVSRQLCVLRKHLRNFHNIYYCKICYKHFQDCDVVGILDICHSCNNNNKTYVKKDEISNVEISNEPENLSLKRSNNDSDYSKRYKQIKLSDNQTEIVHSDNLNCNENMQLSSNETNQSELTHTNQAYCKSSANEFDNKDTVRYCSICNIEFNNSIDYKLHIQIHDHTENYNSRGKCELCNQIFYNYCSFSIHFYNCHSEVVLPSPYILGKKGYKCPICHAFFKDKNTFFTHCVPYSLIKHFSSDCYLCKRRLSSFRALEYHYSYRHKKADIVFACKICKIAKFSDELSLNTHVTSNHNQKMVHCGSCKMDFSDAAYFTSHVESCNKNNLKECAFCDDEAHSSSEHHNNLEFEYLCNICLNYFPVAGNLKQHVENIHGKICVVIDAE